MLRKLNSASKAGFTLVEIMIVVAIIALLAAIAVPNFLRARKRSQATAILEDMRIIDAAKDQYAIENNKLGSYAINWSEARVHVKPDSRLHKMAASTDLKDILGEAITVNAVDTPPKLSTVTTSNFSDVVNDASFWGPYKQ